MRETRLAGPVLASAVVHAAAFTMLFVVRDREPTIALPPIYRVNIVAAPAGPRAIGEVTPAPPTPAQTAPPRTAAEQPVQQMPSPDRAAVPAPRRTTPAPAQTTQPRTAARAGGGPTGGRGTDVATVQTEGIEFPFPGYLDNIVRQIAWRFHPPPDARLKAEVMFLIHRNGSVSNVRFVKRSGSYPFDLEAQGAIEAAASARAFGELPEGFPDDVLPVVFSFDPQVLR